MHTGEIYKACNICPSIVGHNRISHTDDGDTFRPTGTCPTADLAGTRIRPCCPSVPQQQAKDVGRQPHLQHGSDGGRQEQRGTHLKQWMSRNDAEEALEALASGFDHLVRKPVCEDFAWERGDVYAGGLVLEYIAERLKVGIAPAHKRVAQLECRDIRLYRGTSQKKY